MTFKVGDRVRPTRELHSFYGDQVLRPSDVLTIRRITSSEYTDAFVWISLEGCATQWGSQCFQLDATSLVEGQLDDV